MTIQSFDYSVDILRVLLWQYNESENLEGLLQSKSDWYEENQQRFWENWFTDVFDLRTANDFGLSVWSAILELPLFTGEEISPSDYPAFGFGPFGQNFNNGNFANDGSGFVSLTTEEKRWLLQLRYFSLSTEGGVLEINRFLRFVFGVAPVYVLDGLDMTMTYVFSFRPGQRFMDALIDLDVLPRPSGVSVNIIDSTVISWGFGPSRPNFNNGNFSGI